MSGKSGTIPFRKVFAPSQSTLFQPYFDNRLTNSILAPFSDPLTIYLYKSKLILINTSYYLNMDTTLCISMENYVNATIGVGILIGPSALESLNSIERIQPSMMVATFNDNPRAIIISCYSHTNLLKKLNLSHSTMIYPL